MRTCFYIALTLSTLWVLPALAQDTLLVGNSFILSNQPHGVTGVMAGLQEAQGAGTNAVLKDVSKGGYTLTLHARDADGTNGETTLREHLVTGAPEDNAWRTVVLQEQSQTAGFHVADNPFGPGYMWDESLLSVELLNGLISARGADTVFLMTWGYRDGDSSIPADLFSGFPDYPTMQAALIDGYEMYADGLCTVMRTVYVAPAGRAFQQIYDDLVTAGEDPLAPGSVFSGLYSGDGRHPSASGSYLAGCVLHATLTGRDPRRVDWAPDTIPEALRVQLQSAAALVTVEDPYAPRVLAWGDTFRYPFLARWSDLVPAGTGLATLSDHDLRPTAVVDLIVAPVESLVLGDQAGGAGRVGVLEGGRLTVGGDLVIGRAGGGQVDLRGGEVHAATVSLAIEAGSYGALDLRGGLLETETVTEGEGEAALTMTGGTLVAREVHPALQIAGGTWTVTGEGAALGPFDVLTDGQLVVTLPDADRVAFRMDAGGVLMGTLVVSSPAEGGVASGTYTLIEALGMESDALTVDASALSGVETSWEHVVLDSGLHAIVLTVTGGVEEVDAAAGDVGADRSEDTGEVGPTDPGSPPGDAAGGEVAGDAAGGEVAGDAAGGEVAGDAAGG
ncbi:MAG: hypothetical protein QF464_11350, partial [Myxococcota bacterium]|nr:hypothetical protein [Myxococcota bacterium]